MSKAFNSKISLEFQLPTTSKDPKLRSANEFLLSALRALSSVSAKLSGFINENLRMYCWWRTSSRHIWRFVCALNNIHCSPPRSARLPSHVDVSSGGTRTRQSSLLLWNDINALPAPVSGLPNRSSKRHDLFNGQQRRPHPTGTCALHLVFSTNCAPRDLLACAARGEEPAA